MIRAALLSSCLLATSPLPVAQVPPDPERADEPVATTGTEALTRAEFGLWLVDRSGLDHVTEYLVERLAEREAAERDLLPTDEEVGAAFRAERALIVEEFYRGDQAAYERDIVLRNQDPEKHADRRRTRIRADLTLAGLAQADRELTEEQIARRFKDLYGPLSERTRLDVLFISMYRDAVPGDRPNIQALREAALVLAKGAVAALRNGNLFSEVQVGTDPVNSDFVTDTGRIEIYSRRLLGKEVDTAVASLDSPGDVTPPISVFDGYYVVQLVDRVAVSLEETREDVTASMKRSPANSGEIAGVRERLLDQEGAAVLLR